MTYEEGISLLEKLHAEAPDTAAHALTYLYKGFEIKYPGRKGPGDYALVYQGKCPTHEDIVRCIHGITTAANIKELVLALEDIYTHGDSALSDFFPDKMKTLLFLVTLQEESNYPRPRAQGKNLPFWRFFEAALSKLGICTLEEVVMRTNNHGKQAPKPFHDIGQIPRPSFYP